MPICVVSFFKISQMGEMHLHAHTCHHFTLIMDFREISMDKPTSL